MGGGAPGRDARRRRAARLLQGEARAVQGSGEDRGPQGAAEDDGREGAAKGAGGGSEGSAEGSGGVACSGPYTGSSMAMRNPGFKFSARIEPPCSSTALRAMAKPRPVPLDLVEKYGSKMRGRISGGTPGPLSSTETTTF